MLEEFILEKLKALEIEKETGNHRLMEIAKREEEINGEIKRLLEEDDVGRELFSPRNANHDVKKLIAEKKLLLEDLQVEELQVRSQIEQAAERAEQYQKVLLEYRTKGKTELPSDTDSTNASSEREKEYRDALEDTLKRIDKCIGLIYNDKLKCKNELKNLRYYIKAVLSTPDQK